MESVTLDWLHEHYNGIFDEVYFSGLWDSKRDPSYMDAQHKGARCVEIGADFLIDDQPKHCEGAIGAGLNAALLFGEYPWNVHAAQPSEVTRVPDWSAVAEYFGV